MQKSKQKFGKPWLLAGVLCVMPVVALVPGCGGGGSGPSGPVVPNAALVGNYTGTFRFTSGAANGATGTIAVTINSNGTIQGTTTIPGNPSSSFTGRITNQNGAFTFDDNDTVTGTGQLTVNSNAVTGSGNFVDTDPGGGSGTFSLTKTNSTANQFIPGTYRLTYQSLAVAAINGAFNFNVNSSGTITPVNFNVPTVGTRTFSGTLNASGALQGRINDPQGIADTVNTTLTRQSGTVSGNGQIRDTDHDPGDPEVVATFTVVKQ